jgi:hypothetical protein
MKSNLSPKSTLELRVVRIEQTQIRIERKLNAIGAALMEFFLQSDLTPRERGKTPYIVRVLETEFCEITLDDEEFDDEE